MYSSLVQIPINTKEKFPDRVSHRFRDGKKFIDKTYSEFVSDIEKIALGFLYYGIREFDHVSFLVNNRYEWSVTDFALQSIRAVSVPRGSDTTPKESEFIFNHSDSSFLILENVSQLEENRVLALKSERVFIVEYSEVSPEFSKKVVFYKDLFSLEQSGDVTLSALIKKIKFDDVVSIIYTSGTTGNPKGVMLTQNQFIENVYMTAPRMSIDEQVGEVTVTILPAWHAFERTFEYACLTKGISFVYSSLKFFSSDIEREKPHILASVPRVWDSIHTKMVSYLKSLPKSRRKFFYYLVNSNFKYKKSFAYLRKTTVIFSREPLIKKLSKTVFSIGRIMIYFPLHIVAEKIFSGIRDKIGGRLRCAVSGGGSLPVALDKFFSAVGIQVLNAYGMTECSPGIASRSVERNTLGSVGEPFINTEVKILDDNMIPVKKGEKGTLFVKGPQVMLGYYKNIEATREILSEDGWLNTGDLARETIYGDIVLVGRNKDTIVLLGGENIDPLLIEDKIQESEMVDHVMLLGQDKKGLTAFIALNEEALNNFANDLKIKINDIFSFLHNNEEPTKEYKILEKKIKDELDQKITKESGFKPFEKISNVILIKNSFKIGRELTQTLKIKRKQIEETYHSIISRFMDGNDK